MTCERWEEVAVSSEYYTANQKFLVRAESDLRIGGRPRRRDDVRDRPLVVAEHPRDARARGRSRSSVARADRLPRRIQEGRADAYFGHDSFQYGMKVQDPGLEMRSDPPRRPHRVALRHRHRATRTRASSGSSTPCSKRSEPTAPGRHSTSSSRTRTVRASRRHPHRPQRSTGTDMELAALDHELDRLHDAASTGERQPAGARSRARHGSCSTRSSSRAITAQRWADSESTLAGLFVSYRSLRSLLDDATTRPPIMGDRHAGIGSTGCERCCSAARSNGPSVASRSASGSCSTDTGRRSLHARRIAAGDGGRLRRGEGGGVRGGRVLGRGRHARSGRCATGCERSRRRDPMRTSSRDWPTSHDS